MSKSDTILESMDEATAALVEAAHACATLANIDDVLPVRNMGQLWARLAADHGERDWMHYYRCERDDETPVTLRFGQFAAYIERVAELLSRKYEIAAGASLATLTINQPLTVAVYFAAWRIGARVVPVNPGETDDRIGYIVRNSGAKLLLAHRSVRKDFAAVEAAIGPDVRRAMVTDDQNGGAIAAGWQDFDALLAGVPTRPVGAEPPDVSEDAEALVVYTSGTTGHPKGVVLTQRQMLADAYAISQWHGIDRHTIMMNVLPIHHVNGTIVTLVTPAFAAAEVVVNKRFRSGEFWRKVQKHTVHIVSVVPTLLQFILEAGEPYDAQAISSFRHIICGAGPLSVELARDFQDRYGVKIMHGYGLSETVCYSCFLPTDLPWHEHSRWMLAHGFPSIGCPVETNEMAIHDENGRPLPDGQRGEIVIRGHNIMRGYYHNPQANADAFRHGWFRSGDEGFKRRGDDGRDYYFITGRLKELIIRGGVNISPFEIDEVLMSMPGVRVGLAVGFDNRYYGEEVGAYVQVEKGGQITEAQVLEYCKSKLSASKCPKVVIFGDDIPVTSTGKYQRGKLKPLYERHKDTQFK